MYLTDIPTEILLVILEWLARVDLPAFLRCQATSKKLRLLVRDCIYGPVGDKAILTADQPVQPLLMRKFGPLFRSRDCFTALERGTRHFLTLEGDCTRPFKRLPWAKDIDRREAYARPDASWRDLGVSFGCRMPITQLDIVKSYSSEELNEEGRDHVQYMQADLAASSSTGALTMGLLYDLLLCGGPVGDGGAVTFGARETGSWELLLGRRLRSADVLFEYECFIAGDEDLVDSGRDAAQAAVLYVQGGTVDLFDQDRLAGVGDASDWEPEMLGPTPKLLPWQGPEQGFHT